MTVATHRVALGDTVVALRELTVAEVRAWINETSGSDWRDPLHALALEDIGLDELARMSDTPAAALEAFSPSELAPLVDAARALNPFFFRIKSALQWAAGRRAETPGQTSTGPSAGS